MKTKNSVKMLWLIGLVVTSGCSDDPVSATNRPPVLQVQEDTTSVVGDSLFLQALARDPDGDRVRFELTVFLSASEIKSGYFPFVNFDGGTGQFMFRPSVGDRPSREFGFIARDGRGGADSTTFLVTVQ